MVIRNRLAWIEHRFALGHPVRLTVLTYADHVQLNFTIHPVQAVPVDNSLALAAFTSVISNIDQFVANDHGHQKSDGRTVVTVRLVKRTELAVSVGAEGSDDGDDDDEDDHNGTPPRDGSDQDAPHFHDSAGDLGSPGQSGSGPVLDASDPLGSSVSPASKRPRTHMALPWVPPFPVPGLQDDSLPVCANYLSPREYGDWGIEDRDVSTGLGKHVAFNLVPDIVEPDVMVANASGTGTSDAIAMPFPAEDELAGHVQFFLDGCFDLYRSLGFYPKPVPLLHIMDPHARQACLYLQCLRFAQRSFLYELAAGFLESCEERFGRLLSPAEAVFLENEPLDLLAWYS